MKSKVHLFFCFLQIKKEKKKKIRTHHCVLAADERGKREDAVVSGQSAAEVEHRAVLLICTLHRRHVTASDVLEVKETNHFTHITASQHKMLKSFISCIVVFIFQNQLIKKIISCFQITWNRKLRKLQNQFPCSLLTRVGLPLS